MTARASRPGAAPGLRRFTAAYTGVLTAPGAPPLVFWSLVGRFAFAGSNLALLTYVAAVRRSFVAGVLVAVSLAGTAVAGLAQGRLIDRFGPRRPLNAAGQARSGPLTVRYGYRTAFLACTGVLLLCAAVTAGRRWSKAG
ncbi:hypothetical protein EDD90_1906 [Streptomyces sp. Ag109_O5-1]|uniref:hypothetical protein n=1 Tax=Streptomyces sp. Ag109_O5-1 TaxID=1938851 RepID=UPI000F4DA41F|nr:hypothetical protein [Streptomyces sp. Ag109_O5-1]RPE38960.1 hypothetical protein EDD90_1906 [Streptomyces sp. Ag109_O5-1]